MMRRLILLVLVLLLYTLTEAQNIKINDGTFLRIGNGSSLIVNPSTYSPIQKSGNSGGIITESENSQVVVNVSSLSGNFSIPFCSSVGNTIPFTYNITTPGSSGGKIYFTTYETPNNNTPYPSGVTNMGHNGVDNSSMVIDRFWLIDVQGYSVKPKGAYTFTYDDNDLVGNTIYEPALFMQRWNSDNSTWGDWLYSPVANTSSNTISVNIANSQDQYKVWTAVDQGQPLPITLLSFKTNCEKDILEWSTASELNSSLFIIQGTNDGQIFKDIDSVEAAGFSNQIINYSYPLGDVRYSYYRLKQQDFDGREEIFYLISGCPEKPGSIILYPNPNNGSFSIRHYSEALFEVYDVIGRRIWSEKSARVNFDLRSISPGEYIMIRTDGLSIQKMKFIKTD